MNINHITLQTPQLRRKRASLPARVWDASLLTQKNNIYLAALAIASQGILARENVFN